MRTNLRSAGLAAFAFVVFVMTEASAQVDQQKIDADTAVFASDLMKSPSAREWFSVHGNEVTMEHAIAAERIARRNWKERRIDAYPYSVFAMFAFRWLGDESRSLENALDERDEKFSVDDKPEQYEDIRRTSLINANHAASIGRNDLAFDFTVLAADCSFFASTAKTGLKADEPIFNVLEDSLSALELVNYANSRDWLERLVSLLATSVYKVKYHFSFFDEEETRMNALLKELSAAVDAGIPPDFQYSLSERGDQQKSIRTGRVLAALSYQSGDPVMARRRMTIAEERAKRLPDTEEWLDMLSAQYDLEREAGVPADQLRSLREEAVNGSHFLREGYLSRPGRIWAGHLADRYYGNLLRDQLAESRELTAASFSLVESLKAQTLLDVLQSHQVDRVAPPELAALEPRALGYKAEASPRKPTGTEHSGADDLANSEYKLITHLSFFQEDMMSAFGDGKPSPRMEAIAQLEAMYQKSGGGVRAVAATADLGEIQRSLRPKEAILEYVIPYHRSHPAFDLYILLITSGAAQTTHVALNEVLPFNEFMIGTTLIGNKGKNETTEFSQLGKLVVDTRTAIQLGKEKPAQSNLHDLYKILIKPLTDQGVRLEDFDNLVIVPHGPLHYVPFPALMDDQGKYLISKTAMTVVPSASVWLALTRRAGPAGRFVGFGNPDLRSRGVRELTYAAEEMVDIPKILPAASPIVFTGGQATEDRFEREAPSAGILHVSTHGEFPEENAIDLHAILLAKGISGDGALRATRVRNLNLSSTRLVSLSVCNGGLYRMGPADEPYGLVPAFLEAGSQSVLGTLWRLDDQFGKDFMEEFYRHLMEDGPARAYQKTSMHFLDTDEDLRNWAAFILVGPGRPFPTDKRQHSE